MTFVTAHRREGALDVDWDLVTRSGQTVAFYMGFSVVAELAAGLLKRNKDPGTRFTVIANATCKDEEVLDTTLAKIATHRDLASMATPALLIMHDAPARVNLAPGAIAVPA